MGYKNYLLKHPTTLKYLRYIYRILEPIAQSPLRSVKEYFRLAKDYKYYKKKGGSLYLFNLYPCLFDKTKTTAFDPQYFYQAAWAMEKINSNKPDLHIDIASDVKFVGCLSGVVNTQFVDYRPLNICKKNLLSIHGDITKLDFKSDSVKSLSCLHVLEHIGLGRYGDTVDPRGTIKACNELERILAKDGYLYISMPIGQSRVQFNAQKIHTIEEVINLFPKLNLIDFSMVDNDGNFHDSLPIGEVEYVSHGRSDFALGCFIFTKN